MNPLAIKKGFSFPKTANVVLNYFHVDDFLSGSDNLFECMEMQKNIIVLLKRNDFN